ncbi:IS3 family transposase [Coprococcus comes]|nr:IS3 family transposase [Coprococcus comes]
MEISKNLSYEEHIFMSKKQYSKELKLELVKKHLEDGISYWKLGKEYGIEASIIRRWGHKYETFGEDGLEKQNADLCNYSAEFKKKIVLEYLGGDITSQDLAAKYKIHAPSTVRTWIKQYNNPLVFDTFDKAVATNPGATPLLHSDRGYQYTSKAFRRRILAAGMTQSMSRVARCIDNGPMEGFWGLMKREMYYGKKYKTKEELMLAIEKYIDYYTNKRVQRNLEVLTPLEFHEQKLENVA